MAVETELKLSVPLKAAAQVGRHPLLAPLPVQTCRLLNTYFDTPDKALAAQGAALRFRKKRGQWLMTVKRDDTAGGALTRRQEWEFPATPGQFDFAQIGCAKLRRLLEEIRPDLVELFTTHFRRRTWLLEHGGSKIEVAFDRGRIEACGRHLPICELELELLEGEAADLFAVAQALQSGLPLRPMVASKAERGFVLFRQTPAKPCKALPSAIGESMAPVEAFRVLAQSCLLQLQRNEMAGCWRDDPEFIHQARVALRRLRSLLKLFAPVLPEGFAENYGRQWKAWADVLGEARNWDVLLGETLPPLLGAFPDDRRLRQCSIQAGKQAAKTHARVEQSFAGEAYGKLLLDFSAALMMLKDQDEKPLAGFAAKRIRQLAGKARRLADFPGDLKAADWHALRIVLKKLRYALEFLAPLLPQKRLKRTLRQLNAFLEKLGVLNDLETARELCRSLKAGRQNALIEGWLAGRQAQLFEELPCLQRDWQASKLPWKK